ncbi:MAG TPA: tetratricopeptide repeat protein [Desulfobacteria bacterium]|nr:tetratricopeptide repeat protein [Desulfobacteria bacterium]
MSIKKWFGVRKKGRQNEAEDAAAVDEANPLRILNAALQLHESGRFYEAYPLCEKALKRFERLLEADPENIQFQSYVAMTQNSLGILLSVMGRQDEAKERFESALKLVKGQKNQHDTGWTLSLLGRLEFDRDVPDLETAQSFLESGIEKLREDITPFYSTVVNLLALCYYKRGEQTRRETRKEKEKNRIKQLAKESSQFYTLAATNYRKAYELPCTGMPTELLIDAYLADTFSRSVHVIAEADDRTAVTILTESIERIEKAVKLAKKNEEERKRVEGAWHDLVAKQCIRSVSLFKGEPEKQEQLLGDAIDHLIQAALNFEELHADKTAASCQGCACLYNGLKKFRDGIMSDKLPLIAEAHEEFKRASGFYQAAESDVGADVIAAINAVIPELETCYDKWSSEERKPKIAEYLPIYEMINNLIEQVSTAGLRNLFKAYIFDPFMQLVDEQKPKITRTQTDFRGGVIMGDVTILENIQDSTIINKSIVENSFNKVNEKYGEEVATAFLQIAAFIEKSKNREAGELFDTFNEELNKPEPKQLVLKRLWGGIEKALPAIATLSDAIVKLKTLFNQ